MAATRKTAKPDEEEPATRDAGPAPGSDVVADEVHTRGGWDVGYRGEKVDQTPDEAYTVAGVLGLTDE